MMKDSDMQIEPKPTSEFLNFEETVHFTKTDVVSVLEKRTGELLGEIKWFGPWRHYVFFPAPNCAWSDRCLSDLSKYVTYMNERHFARRTLEKIVKESKETST